MSHLPATSHPSHYRSDLQPVPSPLYVICMLEDPLRWRSRYTNYWGFERHIEASDAILYTAEVALGERPFEITSADNPRHLQLRAHNELWRKENALNLLIQRLPADARYVAWIDADIQFARPDWAQETIQQLQHHAVVQLFSQAQDMGPNYSSESQPAHGFAYSYVEGIPSLDRPGPLKAGPYGAHGHSKGKGGVYWHPGFAWAARREALDALGGLMDFAVLGSADWHMATALIGEVEKSIAARYTPNFKAQVREWQRRAERHIRRDIGYVPGLVLHHYHGAKTDRGYNHRYKLMERFDPVRDIKRDTQGLWALDEANIELRDAIRTYARSRREDG